MRKTKVCVVRTDGTNCDRETLYAFQQVGGYAEIVHLKTLIKGYDPASGRHVKLGDYDILAIPGGFSYGDYIASGRIFAVDMMHFLGDELAKFIDSKKLVIGICNGFQVLVKSGLLPRFDGKVEQTTTLTYNDSGRFECRWVNLTQPTNSRCVWTRGIGSIDLPVAHGEGKFVAEESTLNKLFSEGQVVFQYTNETGTPARKFPENPNGSLEAIAGICDSTGLVFGLMPHPERYNAPMNHPLSQLQKAKGELPKYGRGLDIFKNGVEYFR